MEATHVQCYLSGEFIPIEQAVKLNTGDVVDSELERVEEVGGEWYDTEGDDIEYLEDRGEWCLADECRYSELMCEHIHEDDVVWEYSETEFATERWFEEDSDFRWIEYGRARGTWLHYEDARECIDLEDYVHEYDAYWHEGSQEYYYDEDEVPNDYGDRGDISEYHRSPDPQDLSNGSQFKVGIEVEKNSIMGYDCSGEYIGEYDLFKGFETDSSCGVEAITEILPLDDIESDNEKKVFDLFDDAEEIINEEEVNSDCGGHMTVSCSNSLSYWKEKGSQEYGNFDREYINQSKVLREKVRINSSILYAMYRYRLKNHYCDKDKDLKNKYPERYSPILEKSNGTIEFRLFSRIKNVEQLKLRYRLLYKLMDYSVNKDASYSVFLLSVMPILKEMYSGNEQKLKYIIKLSYKFKSFFELGYVDEEVREFLSEYYKPKSKIQETLCV